MGLKIVLVQPKAVTFGSLKDGDIYGFPIDEEDGYRYFWIKTGSSGVRLDDGSKDIEVGHSTLVIPYPEAELRIYGGGEI